MSEGQDVERTAQTAALSAGTEVGGYLVEGTIGEGGMGVVYGARQPRIGKRVAIKVLSPAFCGDPATVERFEMEARLVNEIKHPNIVDVFQFGELPDGRSYFVMEWLEGESLSARLEREPMPVSEVIDVVDAICDALEAAHEKGVIHRDLKSDNVFITTVRTQRKVKLLDFGLAKLAGKTESAASMSRTKDGIVVGTPAYMSPEQARAKHVDHRTDIYALGCLTYKMLTGRLPFTADNPMDLIVKQLNQPPPSPAKLAPRTPPSLSHTVVQMMAKDPAQRPSLADIRARLAELRQGGRAPAERPRGARSVLIGLMLFLSGVIALGAVGILKDRERDAPAMQAAPAAGSAAAAAPETPPIEPAPAEATPIEPAPIEFPADKVESSSARAPRAPASDTVAQPAPSSVPQKPAVGKILLMLERSSQIELDGSVLSTDSRGGTFEVLPGAHTLRVQAPGRQAITRTIEVAAGDMAVLRVGDAPASEPVSEIQQPETAESAGKAANPDEGVYDPASDRVVPED